MPDLFGGMNVGAVTDTAAKATNKPPIDNDEAYKKAQKDKLAGLAGEAAGLDLAAKNAQGGIGAVDVAEKGAIGQMQADSGRAFAASNAQGGGGSLAGMRQNALSRGAMIGKSMGEFARERQTAQRLADQAGQDALKGHTELADANLKSIKEEQAYKALGSTTEDDLKQQYLTMAEDTWFVTTDAEKRDWINNNPALQAALNSPNENVRAAAERVRAGILAGNYDGED
jgi:hypothetical protein